MVRLQTNTTFCCRGLITGPLDGQRLKRECGDVPRCNPCHVCHPDSDMAVFARNALKTPIPKSAPQPSSAFRSAATLLPVTHSLRKTSPLSQSSSSEFTPSMAKAMDAAVAAVQARSTSKTPVAPSSDGFDLEEFTPSMAAAMDSIEGRSFSAVVNSPDPRTPEVRSNR